MASVQPVVISTWNHGAPANDAAWGILTSKDSPRRRDGATAALDAVEAAVMTAEADPAVRSVGYGGRPDRDGKVTLDACIMDHQFRCGSVAALEEVVHAISVARAVMERTPHVMLAGDGALSFALEQGFERTSLLTPDALRLEAPRLEPNSENHDTIATLALDSEGFLAGACTSSGLAGKLHGRVGDSPIIGAGLFVDGRVGAACATGHGELALRVAAAGSMVELMRSGASPQEACETVIVRIRDWLEPAESSQIGVLALDVAGKTGAASLRPGFTYALRTKERAEMCEAQA